jgi:hypothetical protein
MRRITAECAMSNSVVVRLALGRMKVSAMSYASVDSKPDWLE